MAHAGSHRPVPGLALVPTVALALFACPAADHDPGKNGARLAGETLAAGVRVFTPGG